MHATPPPLPHRRRLRPLPPLRPAATGPDIFAARSNLLVAKSDLPSLSPLPPSTAPAATSLPPLRLAADHCLHIFLSRARVYRLGLGSPVLPRGGYRGHGDRRRCAAAAARRRAPRLQWPGRPPPVPRRHAYVKNDDIKRNVLNSVVGTLDVCVRHPLHGEFPTEPGKSPFHCRIYQPDQPKFGYLTNLCVAKYARRQGIASNMLLLAIDAARLNGRAISYSGIADSQIIVFHPLISSPLL